jgi:hypothetical protein
VIGRRLVVGALIALCGLGLTGCHTSPGAAAVIGNTTIPIDALTADASRTFPATGGALGDRLTVDRIVLARLIDHVLIRRLAARYHVSVTPAEVQAEEASLINEVNSRQALVHDFALHGIPPGDLTGYLTDAVFVSKLSDLLIGRTVVHVLHLQQIQVRTSGLAGRLLRELRARPAAFAMLARRYSVSTTTDLGVRLASAVPATFRAAVGDAPAGAVVLAHDSAGWHVLRVVENARVPFTRAPAVIQAGLASGSSTLVVRALVAEANKLGIWVNPRFGSWDPKTQSVVAGGDQLSSPTPTPQILIIPNQ